MRRIVRVILPLMLITSTALRADNGEYLDAAIEEMNSSYYTGAGAGCEDGIFNAVSSSMLGWGIGLAAGIALLTGLMYNSHSSTKTTSTNNSSN